jgi:hypothetical protein
MSKIIKLLAVPMIAASFAVPINVNAAQQGNVSCSVVVDYLLNGALVESYQKAFPVKPGVSFFDDFSTITRQKSFTASTVLDAGKTVVGISYFNDVGVQDAIDFNTKLVLHDKGSLESTSGSYTFTTTAGNIPQRGHAINYSLICKQAK